VLIVIRVFVTLKVHWFIEHVPLLVHIGCCFQGPVHLTLALQTERHGRVVYPLKPRGNYMYHTLYQSVTLHFVFVVFE
jgi:hypothetical protein